MEESASLNIVESASLNIVEESASLNIVESAGLNIVDGIRFSEKNVFFRNSDS